MALIFTRESFLSKLDKVIREREQGDIIITQSWGFIRSPKYRKGELCYLDKKEILVQLIIWKEMKYFSRACNIRELETKQGEKCWLFIIQSDNDEAMSNCTGIPLALFFGNLLVSGLPYITFDKSMLDIVQRSLGRQ